MATSTTTNLSNSLRVYYEQLYINQFLDAEAADRMRSTRPCKLRNDLPVYQYENLRPYMALNYILLFSFGTLIFLLVHIAGLI
jgi:hypothetical protein